MIYHKNQKWNVVGVLILTGPAVSTAWAGAASALEPASYFQRFFKDGGPLVWFVLLPLSVITISLIVQHFLVIRRGRLLPGYFADVVVFDPRTIRDNATFADPHQYATGMQHVFVNGTAVLRDGEHTGALPGQVVRGPGYGKG